MGSSLSPVKTQNKAKAEGGLTKAEIYKKMEEEDLDVSFGLFLHFEMHLTLPKILRCD